MFYEEGECVLEPLNSTVDVALVGGGDGPVLVFFDFDVGVVPEVGGTLVVNFDEFHVFLSLERYFFENFDEVSGLLLYLLVFRIGVVFLARHEPELSGYPSVM